MAPRRSWLILGVASYGQAGFSMFVLGMGAVAPLIQQQYQLSLSETGLVLAMANLGPVLCLVGWGVVNDRWGEGWALAAGLCGAAVALASLSLTTSYLALCLAMLVASGLGSTANVSTGRAVVSAFQPPVRGLALGLRQTASPLAGAAAGVTLPLLAANGRAANAFLALATVMTSGAVAAVTWLRRSPVPPEIGEQRIGFADPRVWRLALASGILLAPQAVVVGLTAMMLTDGRAVGVATAGIALGATQLSGALMRPVLGYWAERWGQPVRTLRWVSLAVGAGTVVIGLAFTAPIWATIAIVVLFGGVSMSWNSVSMGLVAEYGGNARSGFALGLHGTMLFVASAIAVPTFTAIVEASSWRAAFLVLALSPVAAWFVLRRLPGP